jgi:peptidylprolyl isomerase
MKNKNTAIFITAIILLIVIIGAIKMTDSNTNHTTTQDGSTIVKLETNHGDIVIELYAEMPITTGNFKNLVSEGVYDGVIFHRIIDGFMLQGGDPTGTGMGDPKIQNIQDEFTNSDLDKNNRGTISMANAGPNTGSSQFFLNLVDNNFLDGRHPVFGKITEGMDVIDKIAKVQTNAQDKPLEDVVIKKASLV